MSQKEIETSVDIFRMRSAKFSGLDYVFITMENIDSVVRNVEAGV